MSDQSTEPVLGVKPNSQLDLERRLEADHDPKKIAEGYAAENRTEARDFATEDTDTSNYVGVSPEYMTSASATEVPLRGEGGVEAEVEDELMSNTPPVNDITKEVEGKQIVGTGSKEPLIGPSTSGEVWEQGEYSSTDKTVPTTVEDLPSVESVSAAPREAPKPPAKKAAPPKPAEQQ